MYNLLFVYLKGLILGGSICITSIFLDTTICNKNYKMFMMLYPNLYIEAFGANIKNMIIITPITYTIINKTLINHNTFNIDIVILTKILLLQNVLYYIIHYLMHKPLLYYIHNFHHKFDNILLPSLGNAVSKEEFIIAYMSPFNLGAYLFNPNEITYVLSISIIAILNMIIHTQELNHVKWIKYFVSPNQHIEHHRLKNKHYAAPLINIDYCLEQITKKE